MSSLTRFGMTLAVEGASVEDLHSGLNAARRVFDKAGVDPQDAWNAASEIECRCQTDLAGKRGLALQTLEKAALWILAFDESLLACCKGGMPSAGADLSPAS